MRSGRGAAYSIFPRQATPISRRSRLSESRAGRSYTPSRACHQHHARLGESGYVWRRLILALDRADFPQDPLGARRSWAESQNSQRRPQLAFGIRLQMTSSAATRSWRPCMPGCSIKVAARPNPARQRNFQPGRLQALRPDREHLQVHGDDPQRSLQRSRQGLRCDRCSSR